MQMILIKKSNFLAFKISWELPASWTLYERRSQGCICQNSSKVLDYR